MWQFSVSFCPILTLSLLPGALIPSKPSCILSSVSKSDFQGEQALTKGRPSFKTMYPFGVLVTLSTSCGRNPHLLPWFGLVAQSCPTLCNPIDYSLPGSSVHGISQARILEWVATSFSRGPSLSRDQTCISCIAGGFFTNWAIREALGLPNKTPVTPNQ